MKLLQWALATQPNTMSLPASPVLTSGSVLKENGSAAGCGCIVQTELRWQYYTSSSAAHGGQGTPSKPYRVPAPKSKMSQTWINICFGEYCQSCKWTKPKHYWFSWDNNLSILVPEWVRIHIQFYSKRRIRWIDFTWPLRGWKTQVPLKKAG